MTPSPGLQAHLDGQAGRILLDRPRALNALDLAMIRVMTATLLVWRSDPAIALVIVAAEGGRGFCAGGDVRAVREAALAGDDAAIHTFFSEEYALNALVAGYPKPYVALIDGICMGGGLGISVHGQARIATEAALFAMPETGIGLFPDVGASFFLPRLPGGLGLYLGLTGARLTGAEAVHAGIATHFVHRESLPSLSHTLAREGMSALDRLAPPPPSALAALRPAIDRCFAAPDSVADIKRRLAHEGSWGEATLSLLAAASPSALAWSFAIIRAGAERSLAECLEAELALTARVTRHPDFAEGVRAAIIDKDRKPRWQKEQVL